jgi:hypothetical protein
LDGVRPGEMAVIFVVIARRSHSQDSRHSDFEEPLYITFTMQDSDDLYQCLLPVHDHVLRTG